MTRKILLLTLLTFGCAILTPKTGHTTYMKGQSIMEQSKVTFSPNGESNVSSESGTATIGHESVFMRQSPDGTIITTLYFGEVVKVLGKAGGWLLVRYNVTDKLSFVGYVWSGCFVGYEGGCR